MQLFSFGVYGLALAALALVVFGAYDSYPKQSLRCLLSGFATKLKQGARPLNLNYVRGICVILMKGRNRVE